MSEKRSWKWCALVGRSSAYTMLAIGMLLSYLFSFCFLLQLKWVSSRSRTHEHANVRANGIPLETVRWLDWLNVLVSLLVWFGCDRLNIHRRLFYVLFFWFHINGNFICRTAWYAHIHSPLILWLSAAIQSRYAVPSYFIFFFCLLISVSFVLSLPSFLADISVFFSYCRYYYFFYHLHAIQCAFISKYCLFCIHRWVEQSVTFATESKKTQHCTTTD